MAIAGNPPDSEISSPLSVSAPSVDVPKMTKHTEANSKLLRITFLQVKIEPNISLSRTITIIGLSVPIMPTVETGKKLRLEKPM